MITYAEYFADSRKLHQAYYLEIALAAGLTARNLPVSVDKVREALKTDEHLNNIPLAQWDACAASIMGATARHAKARGEMNAHTLGVSVCSLKALARHLAGQVQA